MRSTISMFMVVILMTGSGCWLTGTSSSSEGGVVPKDEGFSISVPSSVTITQGENLDISVTLKRGAEFKQDVRLEAQADGIDVRPARVRVDASELPDVKYNIEAGMDAALGKYSVYITGTPTSGKPTTAVITVTVKSP